MFTDYSQPYPAEIGKFPWKKIWTAVKTVASTLFPGPYAIAAGAVSLFSNENRGGGLTVDGLGALTDEQKEKRAWVKLMQQLTPEQREQLNTEASKLLQTNVSVVETAQKQAIDDTNSSANNKWLLLGGAALAAYLFWPKRN